MFNQINRLHCFPVFSQIILQNCQKLIDIKQKTVEVPFLPFVPTYTPCDSLLVRTLALFVLYCSMTLHMSIPTLHFVENPAKSINDFLIMVQHMVSFLNIFKNRFSVIFVF